MTYDRALDISCAEVISRASVLYGLEDYSMTPVTAHDGGRNIVYVCSKGGKRDKILRVSFMRDRNREDYLAELEYVRYLSANGCSVAGVIDSQHGRLLEEVWCEGWLFFICLFERAPGKLLVDNHYRYREGAPLEEYFYNSGKLLGRLHALSKKYTPVHRRHSFFERFNDRFIEESIPARPRLRARMKALLRTAAQLEKSPAVYGLLHFDFNDGNYNIDFETGKITVFDFDDACYFFYMYDLAELWTHGVGWIQFEPDPGRRKAFMDAYFKTALEGYGAETAMDDAALTQLPFFIDIIVLENILAYSMLQDADAGELRYLIRCLEEEIPYRGFFHPIYDSNTPFSFDGPV